MPINASSLLVGTERRRARRTYVATLHANIPTNIQLTGFAIEVDPSPISNWPHVRFGSKADMCNAKRHVRLTPDSGRPKLTRRDTMVEMDYGPTKLSAGCPFWVKRRHMRRK